MNELLLDYVSGTGEHLLNYVRGLNDVIREKVQEGVLVNYYDWVELPKTEELIKAMDLEEEFLDMYCHYVDLKASGWKGLPCRLLSMYIGCPVDVVVKHIDDIEVLAKRLAEVIFSFNESKAIEECEPEDGVTAYELVHPFSVRKCIGEISNLVDMLKSYSNEDVG